MRVSMSIRFRCLSPPGQEHAHGRRYRGHSSQGCLSKVGWCCTGASGRNGVYIYGLIALGAALLGAPMIRCVKRMKSDQFPKYTL